MKKILVTSIGSYSADIAIKSLKSNGYYVVGCDIYPQEWIANSLNVDHFQKAPLVKDEKEYLDFILSICKEHKIKYIIPLIDYEVDILSGKKEWLYSKFNIVVCTSNFETIKVCRNKFILPKRLVETNITNLIPTEFLKTVELKNISYPSIIKPVQGRSSQGVKTIRNIEELENFISFNNIDDYIIQPLIEGDIIVTDVIRNSLQEEVVSISRKELLRNSTGAGTTVEILLDTRFNEISSQIVEELNIEGTVCIEYILTRNDEIYLLEINPRFSGGIVFSFIAGYDFIKNHLNVFANSKIEPQPNISSLILARKYEEYITRSLK